MQYHDHESPKIGWFSNWRSWRNLKSATNARGQDVAGGLKVGVAFDTIVDGILDCLFMVLFLVLVIMTTLAYGW